MLKIDKCTGCRACELICNMHAINMVFNDKGFLYPKIDKEKCIKCGLCDKICNTKIHIDEIINEQYACININDLDRKNSSSGGVFALMAKKFLQNNGIVYGSKLDIKTRKVFNFKVEIGTLKDAMKSKYIQSDTLSTYKEVKAYLENDKKVLYTGTPCQIDGLLRFLQKKYINLITIDLICHGVPSPYVFNKYISELEYKHKSKIINYDFRDKSNGWKIYNTKIHFQNGDLDIHPFNNDPYMKLFLANYDLRDSCYNCSSKNNHVSDITIGDFWGADNLYPQFDDDKGISAVIIRTKKGLDLFTRIKNEMIVKRVSLSNIVSNNGAYDKSVDMPRSREKFFKEINNHTISRLSKKYVDQNIFKRLVKKMYKALIALSKCLFRR